jgi:PAS domain S-box-containing protein
MKLTAGSKFSLICITAIAIFFVGLSASDSFAIGQEIKHVFVLNSYHRGYPFSDNEMRGIDDAFSKSGLAVEIYASYMDMKRIPTTRQYFRQLKELIKFGYKGIHFETIIACDNDALDFVRQYRNELFPGVPVVFTGINDFDGRMLDGRSDITGTSQSNDYAGTISIALKLRPATKSIVVVTDNTTTGKAHRSAVEKIRPDFSQSLGFTYLSLADMTLEELAEKLSKLSGDSIVLLLHHSVDRTGTGHSIPDSASFLAKSASVPVFVVSDSRMGFGVLGGHLVSGYSQGETAAKMALKILGGIDVRTIPVLRESPNKYIFDYGVMQRFSIAESELPPLSTVINRPESVFDKYRNQLLFILGAFIVLCGLIIYLLFEIRRRKLAEEAARESEARFRNLLQDVKSVAVQGYGPDGTTQYWNQASERFYGYSAQEAIGRNLLDLIIPPEMREGVEQAMRQMAETGQPIPASELSLIRKDGSRVSVFSSHAIVHVPGRMQELFCMDIDLTEREIAEAEREKLEDQLVQAQKMEAIGQLAGGVAHDFNNILAAIVSFGYLLEMQLKGNEKGTQYVSQILQAAERAAALTQGLLAFSRKQHSEPQPIDLNATIQKTEKILARTIGEDIRLSLRLTEQNISVQADGNQMVQVLMNLATNARDSMPNGGDLIIGTERVLIDEAFVKMHGYGRDGEYVVMTVEDRGAGMDAATMQKIFEPFFTTKEVGKGTGLGLSMVYGIVKQHNGFIDVYSEVGKGTIFKVYLPALEMNADPHEIKQVFEPERATETILLVEDDGMLRKALTQMLQEFGHAVIEACDGEDAVAKFLEHKDEIQLVLMDVIMPRKSGRDAYHELRAIRPELKIIMMSGYAGDYLSGKLSLEENVNFIEKPVSAKSLFEKIRSVLSDGTA